MMIFIDIDMRSSKLPLAHRCTTGRNQTRRHKIYVFFWIGSSKGLIFFVLTLWLIHLHPCASITPSTLGPRHSIHSARCLYFMTVCSPCGPIRSPPEHAIQPASPPMQWSAQSRLLRARVASWPAFDGEAGADVRSPLGG